MESSYKKTKDSSEAYYEQKLDRFLLEDSRELALPNLAPPLRKMIHSLIETKYASQLSSISTGKGSNRTVIVSKGIPTASRLTPETLSQKSRKLIVTDYHLLIPSYSTPYFEYFFKLFDTHFGLTSIFNNYINALEDLGGETKLLGYAPVLENKIVESLTSTTSFKLWKKSKTPIFTKSETEELTEIQKSISKMYKSEDAIRCGGVYHPHNHGHYFLSIDLKCANFNILKDFDPGLMMDCNTWEDLVSKFSPHQYFVQGKKFRQRVFSKPAMLPSIQRQMMEKATFVIYKSFIESDLFTQDQLRSISGDELIFEINADKGLQEFYDKVKDFADTELPRYCSFLKFEVFRLQQISPNYGFYAKEIFSNTALDSPNDFKVSFKCINAREFPLCFKHYYKLPVHEYDGMFCKERVLLE